MHARNLPLLIEFWWISLLLMCSKSIFFMGFLLYLGRVCKCSTCQRKFSFTNSDSSCICIQDMFPAYLTRHAGIDKTLLNDICSLISEGTFDNQECSEGGNLFILDLLKRLQYYSYCRNLLLGQLAFSNKNQKVINKSGSLSSPSGCNESIELKSKEQKYLCYQLEIKASSTQKSRAKTFYIVWRKILLLLIDILEQFARKCGGINIFPKIQSHLEKHLKW